MNREESLVEIVRNMKYPAIQEILAYRDLHPHYRVSRALAQLYYQSIYYYLNRLCEKKVITRLHCTGKSGYRNRYCLSVAMGREKRRLRPILKFVRNSYSSYSYRLGVTEIEIDFSLFNNANKIEMPEHDVSVLFDIGLYRYYIVLNTLLVAVIDAANKKIPRLPGPTFTSKVNSEYQRCYFLMQQNACFRSLQGVLAERRATQ